MTAPRWPATPSGVAGVTISVASMPARGPRVEVAAGLGGGQVGEIVPLIPASASARQ